MVDMSTLLAAVVEEMENSDKHFQEIEATVCNLNYIVRDKNVSPDEAKDICIGKFVDINSEITT